MSRFGSLIALAFLLTPLPSSPAIAAGTWATFRGPQGTGEAVESLPPGNGPLAFELRWKRSLGGGYSGISVSDDTLITAFADGERDYVVALDPATGDERWRFDLSPTYSGHDGSHNGPISTPAIADGRVFAFSPWGHLVALALGNGEVLWKVHVVDDLGSEKPMYGFGSSPKVIGDMMVLQIGGAAGAVAGFDAATGEIRWRAFEDEIGTESPIVAEIGGRQQLLALGTSKLAGLDPADGTVLWELEHNGEMGGMGSWTSSPLPLGDDRILLKYEDATTAIVEVTVEGDGMVPAILATGRGMSKSYSPPSRAGQHVFGYTARFLSAADRVSGELLWRSREPGDGFLIAIGDHLVVLTKTGSLHLGAASPAGWQESLRLQLFDDLAWTPPSYAGGALYVRSLGEIARVELVRAPELVAETGEAVLPAALEPLAAEIATTDDPAGTVDRFLEGRDLPLIGGKEVIFLWRGEAEDLAIAGDMIGMRREEPMQQLAGTDLWWWATDIDPRARVSYMFYVDFTPTPDPTHDRVIESTVLGPDMNWRRAEGVAMSWFAMPEWPGLKLASLDSAKQHRPGGRLDLFEFSAQPPTPEGGEPPEPVSIDLHVWLPPDYDETNERYPVVYVHNSFAREVGNWPEALDRVVGKTAAPVIAVLLELPRMRGQGEVIVEQIIPAIDERYRTLQDREQRANIGMGWPGFEAALTTFSNPDLFGILGVQSFFALDEHMKMLRTAIGEAEASTLPLRIYLEWGRWDLISPHEEMNMRASSQLAWDLLTEKGWEPTGGEVWDSTDWASWHNRTGVMLETLFPLVRAESGLAAWQTSAR